MASKRVQGDEGKFELKGDAPRHVRSIRLTDATWENLGEVAAKDGITRADLLEKMTDFQPSKPAETTPGTITTDELHNAIAAVMSDPAVTRNGKDRGAVKRTMAALIERLG